MTFLRRALPAALVLLLLLPGTARAILYIDINAPSGKRMPVAVPDFVSVSGDPLLARALPEVLGNDLSLTGLFSVIPEEASLERITAAHFAGTPLSLPAWKTIGAEAVVIGKVEGRGDQIAVEMRLYDATLGTMMAGKRYTGPSRRYRMMAHRFANEVLQAFTGVRGIFDTEIVFSARPKKGRGKEIYTVGMDGKDLRQVTDNRSFNLFPRWTPDGQSIAYTSFRTGVPVIWLRNLSDGKERPLVEFGSSKTPGCFSPAGDFLYASVSLDGNSDIFRIPMRGGRAERVVGGYGIEVSPSLSPDGRRLAFVSDRGGSPQVYVRDLAGGQEARISRAGSYSTSPSWSPAGDLIAFTSLAGGKYSVYLVRPDGSDQRVLASADGDCIDPAFSTDGRYVVYTYQKKGYSELKIISIDGRLERSLISGLSEAGSPSWSPRR